MNTWTGTYRLDSAETSVTIDATDLDAALAAFNGLIPGGGEFVSIALAPSAVIASATAKLVELGLTLGEAGAVVGSSSSD